jgi:hypothetical protein
MTSVYQQLRRSGSSAGTGSALMPFADMTRLMGFEDVWAFERRYAEPTDQQPPTNRSHE